MDYLLTLQFLIISCVIGILISFVLNIKSYLLIAVICVLIFISIELYYNYKMVVSSTPDITKQNIISEAIPKLLSNIFSYKDTTATTVGATITSDGSLLILPGSAADVATTTMPNVVTTPELMSYEINQNKPNRQNMQNSVNPMATMATASLSDNKMSAMSAVPNAAKNNTVNIVDSNDTGFDMNKPPFDGLGPSELLSRLNYIYYATANPAKMVNYHEFKTHADKYLDEDMTKLSTNDPKLQAYSAFYPQLTTDQIDARDCLNEGSGPRSCFQSPQLFHNVKNNFNILDKGVNLDNANLVVREDFSMPMNLNPATRYDPVLFMNAPQGNLDKLLDQQSNERIDLSADAMSTCHSCKLAVCKDDICSLQNKLFM